MKTRFESLGLYLPEKVVSTHDLLSRMKNPLALNLEEKTGIKTRRVCSENENSFILAVNAAKDCLKNSSYKASDLDIIINASISRHIDESKITYEPAFSLFIKNKLNAKHAMNCDITNACAGMTTGIYILDNMIRAGAVTNGMVVSGEHNSLISESALLEIENIYDEQISSLTVGDCGAAIIMDKSQNNKEGIDFIDFLTYADYADLCISKPSCHNPFPAMYAKPKKMHDTYIINSLPQFMEDTFNKHGKHYNLDLYEYIITHQVSVKAIELHLNSLYNHFKIKAPSTRTIVEEFGNTSSTSHFAVLYNNLKQKKIKKDSRVLLFSTGSGISFGVISFVMGQMNV